MTQTVLLERYALPKGGRYFVDPPSGLDDLAKLQNAVDAVHSAGGGLVELDIGIYRTSGPLRTYSNVLLNGVHWTGSFIKPLNDAVFAADEGVVMTDSFTQDADLWNYYEPYPEGLHMGVGLFNMCIDANREHVANANGLMLYGGKYTFDYFAVINSDGHGIWTECGNPNSSTMGDDLHDYLNMHESYAGVVFIANANKHGWLYRGANDSMIDNLQVKTCKWGGFLQDKGENIATGGLKIGQLHAYACNCEHPSGYMIELASAQADKIYTDTSLKGGVKLSGASQVSQILSFKNNPNGAGDYYSVLVETRSSIGQIRITSNTPTTTGTDGGGVHVAPTAERTFIGSISATSNGDSTVPSVGLKVEATGTTVGFASLFGYDTGLTLNKSQCRIFAQISASELGFDYQNTSIGRNDLRLMFDICVKDYETDVRFGNTDTISFSSSSATYPITTLGDARIDHMNMPRSAVSIAVPTTTAIDASKQSVQSFNLAAALTLSAPTNAEEGDILKLLFFQSSPGGNNVTFDAIFLSNFSNTGNTTGKRSSINFIFNGTQWQQDGGFSGWY